MRARTPTHTHIHRRAIASIRESVYGLLSNAVRTSSPSPLSTCFVSFSSSSFAFPSYVPRPLLLPVLLSESCSTQKRFRADANALVKTDDDNVENERNAGCHAGVRRNQRDLQMDRMITLEIRGTTVPQTPLSFTWLNTLTGEILYGLSTVLAPAWYTIIHNFNTYFSQKIALIKYILYDTFSTLPEIIWNFRNMNISSNVTGITDEC